MAHEAHDLARRLRRSLRFLRQRPRRIGRVLRPAVRDHRAHFLDQRCVDFPIVCPRYIAPLLRRRRSFNSLAVYAQPGRQAHVGALKPCCGCDGWQPHVGYILAQAVSPEHGIICMVALPIPEHTSHVFGPFRVEPNQRVAMKEVRTLSRDDCYSPDSSERKMLRHASAYSRARSSAVTLPRCRAYQSASLAQLVQFCDPSRRCLVRSTFVRRPARPVRMSSMSIACRLRGMVVAGRSGALGDKLGWLCLAHHFQRALRHGVRRRQ